MKTTSFCPIVFQPPGTIPSVHVCIYLPTAGQDAQFIEELSSLSCFLHEMSSLYPKSPFYLRGDFNVNNKNLRRKQLLNQFMETLNMKEMELNHPTYHQFVGSGANDSHLDKVLYSSPVNSENLETIICCKENPLVESHHDVILSITRLPSDTYSTNEGITRSIAPKVPNDRHRITWSETGISDYQKLVMPHLNRL